VALCTASQADTGGAVMPCTATVTGGGGLSLTPPTLTYATNTDVGTASASYTFIGDANHAGSSDTKTFAIGAAASTTTVTCPTASQGYTGSALTPCTVIVTGAGDLN